MSFLNFLMGPRSSKAKGITAHAGFRTKPSLENLEERSLMNATTYDVYAIDLINHMRANPAAFGEEIRQLYNWKPGQPVITKDGMRSDDPVWTDLRADISCEEGNAPGCSKVDTTRWYSGLDGRGGDTFLSEIRNLPPSAPLALDNQLQAGAEGHDNWMFNNCYGHSVFPGRQLECNEGPGKEEAPIAGIRRNLNPTQGDPFNTLGFQYAGENISYAGADFSGQLPNTVRASGNNAVALYTRVAYFNTLSYILDWGNGPFNPDGTPRDPKEVFGHLRNLGAKDPSADTAGNLALLSAGPKSAGLPTFNVIGVDIKTYPNPNAPNPSGLNNAYFTTHRLGWKPGQAYISGVLYNDQNHTGHYAPGEGIWGQVNISPIAPLSKSAGPQSAAGVIVPVLSTGYFSVAVVPNWIYEVQAFDGAGKPLGFPNHWVAVTAANAPWLEFTPGGSSGLTDPGGASQPNNSPAAALNLGNVATAGSLTGTTPAYVINQATQHDWFRFGLAGQGGTGSQITLAFPSSLGALGARLSRQTADGSLQPMQTSAPAANGATLNLAGVPSGTYFLDVFGQNGASNAYTLSMNAHLSPPAQRFIGGQDHQVYAAPLAADSGSVGAYRLVDPGAVKAVAAGHDATGRAEVFAIGLDNQVWAHKLDDQGKPSGGYFLVGPGQVKALVVGQDAAGRPEVFAIGLDNQVWAHKLDDQGNTTGGYFLVGPGQVKALATGQDAAGRPEVFAIGLDNQVWAHKLDDQGNTTGGYVLVGAGQVKTLRVGRDVAGRPEVFVIGLDDQVWAHRLDATGSPVGGYFLVGAGRVKDVRVGATAGGQPEVFAIGLDNQVWAHKLDDQGSPVGGYFLVDVGQVKALDLSRNTGGNWEVFVSGLDDQVYAHRLADDGTPLGNYFGIAPGKVSALN
jgi:hypothetical protein